MLPSTLDEILEFSEDSAVRAVAKTCKSEWMYPVDSQVLNAKGELLGAVWVQDLMNLKRPSNIKREPFTFRGSWINGYMQFLDEAWEKWLGDE